MYQGYNPIKPFPVLCFSKFYTGIIFSFLCINLKYGQEEKEK